MMIICGKENHGSYPTASVDFYILVIFHKNFMLCILLQPSCDYQSDVLLRPWHASITGRTEGRLTGDRL